MSLQMWNFSGTSCLSEVDEIYQRLRLILQLLTKVHMQIYSNNSWWKYVRRMQIIVCIWKSGYQSKKYSKNFSQKTDVKTYWSTAGFFSVNVTVFHNSHIAGDLWMYIYKKIFSLKKRSFFREIGVRIQKTQKLL